MKLISFKYLLSGNSPEEEEVLLEEGVSNEYELIVFNDEVNTFDHVIETLIKVCDHTPHQAEQCTWIIHFTGKCTVKAGGFEELKPMKEGICDAGIKAEIY